MKTVIIKQGGGIGDILYSLKIAEIIHKTNNCNIIWPINSYILSDFRDYIKIPYIEWVEEKEYKWLDDYNYFINGESTPSSLKVDKETAIFPLCEAANNPDGTFKGGPIMGKKYSTFKLSQNNWQDSIKITRNPEKENELFYNILKLNDKCKYIFAHKIYSTPSHGLLQSGFMPEDFLPGWEKDYEALVTGGCLEEYSVFDWIKVIENAGFSSRKHLIHWHSLLASPFLFIGMVLIGASFSVKPLGRKGIGTRVFSGVLLAFFIFFLNDIATVLGQGSNAPVEIAAWVPALIPILLSASILLYLEDG